MGPLDTQPKPANFRSASSGNWRAKSNGKPRSQDDELQKVGNPNLLQVPLEPTLMFPRTTDKPYNHYEPGMIISGAVHTQAPCTALGSGQIFVHGTRKKTTINLLGPVLSTFRIMVVVQVFAKHCIAMPLFTRGGTGILKLPKAVQLEHALIHEVGAQSKPGPEESCYTPLECIMEPGFTLPSNCYIYFTNYETVPYYSYMTIEGQLTDASFEELKKLSNPWQSAPKSDS